MDKQGKVNALKAEAEKILDFHCDSLPAWTERRKEAVINAMLDYGEKIKSIKETIPCECKYSMKAKGRNACQLCGGKYVKP